jgi:AI-2 transport protein TqsA
VDRLQPPIRALRNGAIAGPAHLAWTVAAIVIVLGAVSIAKTVVAPVAFALFLIALIWPLQARLQALVPPLSALLVSILVLMAAFGGFASLIVWGFGRVARWIIANVGRFQSVYEQAVAWLDGHGIAVAGLWAEHFSGGWLVGAIQRLTGQMNTTLSFWLIVLVYVILGLLEVEGTARKIQALPNRDAVHVLMTGTVETAVKIRRYMMVRTLMSVLTGVLVWMFGAIFGLPLAQEWGVIAFTLNYIPFLGPFVATLLPTLLALVQYESWHAIVTIFTCLNAIQFVVGNYLEPRLSGSALAMSPFFVLVSIFLWTFLWGLPGTFIGVPISVAVLTFCVRIPSTRWLAVLLGSPDGQPANGDDYPD